MDKIEKKTVLRASLDKVWEAISDSSQFGTWFGMRFDGPFEAGTAMSGVIMPTVVDAEVAAAQKPHEGKAFKILIEEIQPKSLFSFRWHPYAIDEGHDYSTEPMTLVSFALEEVSEGVQLTITESGFDQIPLERRAEAFKANDGGWTMQVVLITKYLDHAF